MKRELVTKTGVILIDTAARMTEDAGREPMRIQEGIALERLLSSPHSQFRSYLRRENLD